MKDEQVVYDKEYDNIEFEEDKIIEVKRKIKRKTPTSISLSEETISKLKVLAEEKGIPYQVLMRSFILEGLERIKKAV